MGKKKKNDDLDQYKDITIANMNVEGMPWYIKKPPEDDRPSGITVEEEKLTPKETRRLIANAVAASLFVGGIFLLLIFLFLLFCVYVWL